MINLCDTNFWFRFKNDLMVFIYDNTQTADVYATIRPMGGATFIQFGNISESPALSTDEIAELLNIARCANDFDACQAAVNLWLFKKQPKPSSDEGRFLACQTFRDTQSFIFMPGMKCWLDYTDPVKEGIDKDWVLSRGPEWVVAEVIYYFEGDYCITVCQQNKPSVFFCCMPTQLVPAI